MPRRVSKGDGFHLYFGESDLRAKELPSDLDCAVCLEVAEMVKRGVVFDHALKEARGGGGRMRPDQFSEFRDDICLFVNCRCCQSEMQFSSRGVRRKEVEQAKREHVCEVRR
jgi:hypothetical protein